MNPEISFDKIDSRHFCVTNIGNHQTIWIKTTLEAIQFMYRERESGETVVQRSHYTEATATHQSIFIAHLKRFCSGMENQQF